MIKNKTITFSIGRNANDPQNPAATTPPVKQETTVEQFVNALTSFVEVDNKRDCLWFCPSTFKGNLRRKNEVKKTGSFMAFDFDGADNAGVEDTIIDTWLRELQNRDITYAAVTSFSHFRKSAEGKSRCRIVLFANQQIKESDWLSVWKYWAKYFSDPNTGYSLVDRTPQHTAAVFYTGHPKNETRRWSKSYIGEGFDPSECLCDASLSDLFERKTLVKKDGVKRTAPRSNKSLAWRGEKLDRSTPVDLADGRTVYCDQINPGDKFPCFSPWRNEKSPSAFIAATDKGSVFVFDSGDQTTRFFFRDYKNYDTDLVGVSHLSSLIEKKDSSVTPPERKYIADIIGDLSAAPSQYHLVRAPLGAGKSWWAAEQAKRFESVICVIDSVALAKASSKAFNLEEYSEVKESTRLCTTTHSAHKFSQPTEVWTEDVSSVTRKFQVIQETNIGWDLAIGDEIVGIMNAWVSPILKGMGQIAKETTLEHLTSGGASVLMSADFTPGLMDLVEDLIKARDPYADITRHEIPVEKGQRHISLYKARHWKKEMLQAAEDWKQGENPIVVLTTSTSSPHVWKTQVDELRPDMRTLAISSDNSDTPEIRELLSNPDGILESYDMIFLSPTVKAGFSFTKPVKQVFASYTGGVVARDFAQMLMRVRNPECKEIITYVAESHGEWQTSTNYLEKLALRKATNTEDNVDTSMIHFSIDPKTKERKPHDPELLRIWTYFERERRLTENNRIGAFLARAEFHGWTFDEVEEVELSEEEAAELAAKTKEAKEALEAQRMSNLLSASPIGSDKAEEIDNAHVKTREEKTSLERFKIEEFYGQEISQELIEADKKGKTRKIIRDYVVFNRWQKGEKEAAVIKDYHNTTNKHATEYKHTCLRMRKFDDLIRMGLGCSLEEYEGQAITKDQLTEVFDEYLQDKNNRQSIQEILGSKCTESTARNPSKWFFELTKKVGAQWESKQVRRDGERVWEYTLSLSKTRELAAAEETRIDQMIDDMKDEEDNLPYNVEEMLARLVA